MNTQLSSSKNTMYWIIGIIVVSLVVYFMFFTSPADTGSGSMLEFEGGKESIGADVLGLLNQIQSLKIDSSIFRSAVYKSLQDFSVEVPPEGVGRDNPFAPFPGYIGSQSAVTSGR